MSLSESSPAPEFVHQQNRYPLNTNIKVYFSNIFLLQAFPIIHFGSSWFHQHGLLITSPIRGLEHRRLLKLFSIRNFLTCMTIVAWNYFTKRVEGHRFKFVSHRCLYRLEILSLSFEVFLPEAVLFPACTNVRSGSNFQHCIFGSAICLAHSLLFGVFS